MKILGKFLIAVFVIIAIVIAGMVIKDVARTSADIIYSNWSIRLPESSKDIYYKDTGASFQGDGNRWTVVRAGSEADIDELFEWKTDRNPEIERTLLEGMNLIGVDQEHRVDLSGAYRYYVKEKVYTDESDKEFRVIDSIVFINIPRSNEIYIYENLF